MTPEIQLTMAIIASVVVLLLLIIKGKVNAFISLLVASIVLGIGSGVPIADIANNIKDGMGGTLGFIATIVGLGAIFGAILEHSGGIKSLANYLIKRFGDDKAPIAMLLSGFVIAIPVFFDVAFIILIPFAYSIARRTGKSLMYYALPLLTGLAITHSFIPPTPGPVLVAEYVGVDLGWVILFGAIVGIPTAIISGVFFSNRVASQIYVAPPPLTIQDSNDTQINASLIRIMLLTIVIPIVLILGHTTCEAMIKSGALTASSWTDLMLFLGNPIIALILATFVAFYFLGTRQGFTKAQLSDISMKSFAPVGAIILITGAGGAYKTMLSASGAGKMIGEALANFDASYVIVAFIIAALVRIAQGSATVAMTTAAGIIGPILEQTTDISSPKKALIVLAVASGATILSHVNDSGFWLVNRYLNISEKDTFRSWTMLTTVISVSSIVIILGLYWLV